MMIDAIDPTNAAVKVAELQKSQQSTSQNSPSANSYGIVSPSGRTDTHSSDRVTINVEIPRKNLETLQQFGQLGDYLNTLATNLRKTKEGLNAASDLIGKMKEPLDKIRKNYPPFDTESKERMELLMSYSSLRAEINSLLVPAPPPPVYEKVEHLWQGLFSDKNGTISATQLPTDAPDSHVKIAAAQLNSFSDQISVIREELSNSIKAI